MTIQTRLLEIVATLTGRDRDELTPDMRLVEDLNVDSLGKCELALALERAFGVSISDEDAEAIQVLGDALAVLRRRLTSGSDWSAPAVGA